MIEDNINQEQINAVLEFFESNQDLLKKIKDGKDPEPAWHQFNFSTKIPVEIVRFKNIANKIVKINGHISFENDFNRLPDNDKVKTSLTPEEVLSKYEYLRITDKTPIPIPEPVLKINGEIIAVVEDIFTVSGASKSGKSAFVGMLIAGAISETGKISDGLDGVEILCNSSKKAVIHFDTEQPRHKHKNNLNVILKRAELTDTPSNYLSYNIRQMDIDQYKGVSTDLCDAAYKLFGGIHSIYIDGGADYIADVNDPATSNEAIKFFGDLAIKYHTAIFIIVHTNPGSDKERGHFGSQCQRKSGGIISVRSEGDINFIEPKILRYAGKSDVPQLMFSFDKSKGYFVGSGVKDDSLLDEQSNKRKLTKLWEVCKTVFSGQKSFEYRKVIDEIMRIRSIADRQATSDFTQMRIQGMIIQDLDKIWRINHEYES